MPFSNRQNSFLSAAKELPEYFGWSDDEISQNISDVISSGDNNRVSGLTSALSKLGAYGGWSPDEISSNVMDIWQPEPEVGQDIAGLGTVTHKMPDGTEMAGPEHEGAVPGSEYLQTQPEVAGTTGVSGDYRPPEKSFITKGVEKAKSFASDVKSVMRGFERTRQALNVRGEQVLGEIDKLPYEERSGAIENLSDFDKHAVFAADLKRKTGGGQAFLGGIKRAIPGSGLVETPAEKEIAEERPIASAAGATIGNIGAAIIGGQAVGQLMSRLPVGSLIGDVVTRIATSGGLAAGQAIGRKEFADGIMDAIQQSGGGAISVLPELIAPPGVMQVIAQPLTDLVYDVAAGKIRGENVGTKDWWLNEIVSLGTSAGFALKDATSGKVFADEQIAKKEDLKNIIKRVKNLEIVPKGDIDAGTDRGAETQPTTGTKPEGDTGGAEQGTETKETTGTGEETLAAQTEQETSDTQKDEEKLPVSDAETYNKDNEAQKPPIEWKIKVGKRNAPRRTLTSEAQKLIDKDVERGKKPRSMEDALVDADLATRETVTGQPSIAHFYEEVDKVFGQEPTNHDTVQHYHLHGDEEAFLYAWTGEDGSQKVVVAKADIPNFGAFNDTPELGHDFTNDLNTQYQQYQRDVLAESELVKNAKTDKEKYAAFVETLRQMKADVEMIDVVLPNGNKVKLGLNIGVATDPAKAETVLTKEVENVGRNSIVVDEGLKKLGIEDTKGTDLTEQYYDAGMRSTKLNARYNELKGQKTTKAEVPGGEQAGVVDERGADIGAPTETKGAKVTTEQPMAPTKEAPKKEAPIKTVSAPRETAPNTDLKIWKTAESLAEYGLEAGTDQTYTPQKHSETQKRAADILGQGATVAERFVRESEPTAERTVVAFGLIKYYQDKANAAKQEASAEAYMEKAVDLATEIVPKMTKAGQAIEAVKMLAELGPERTIVRAQRAIGKEKLTADDAKRLTNMANVAKEASEVYQGATNVKKISKALKAGKQPTAAEIGQLKSFADQINNLATEKGQLKSLKKILGEKFDRKKNEALNKIKEIEKGQRLQAGLPADLMSAYVELGAAELGTKGLEFGEWSKRMIDLAGEKVKPHLSRIYPKSKKTVTAEKTDASRLRAQAVAVKDIAKKLEVGEIEQTIKEDLDERFSQLKDYTGEDLAVKVMELNQAIERLKPVSFLRKVSTAQTMSQLLNPKTILRNIGGNEMFHWLERGSKYPATMIDMVASKFTGERTVSTKTGRKAFGYKDYIDGLKKGTKFATKGLRPPGFETKFDVPPETFVGKKGELGPLGKAEKALGITLGATDYAAYNRAKMETIGEMAHLAAINQNIPKSEYDAFIKEYMSNVPTNIQLLAHEAGKYETFQDENIISNQAVALKRWLNAGKDWGFGDVLLKYPKTPANLIARALDYSPIGILRSTMHLANASLSGTNTSAIRRWAAKGFKPEAKAEAMKQQRDDHIIAGEFDQRQFSLQLSRALVGSVGITGLGILLRQAGVLSGSPEDRKVRELKRQTTGEGPYQVNTSAITRFVVSGFDPKALEKQRGDKLISYDWAQPIAVSVAMGANIGKQMDERSSSMLTKTTSTFDVFLDALSGGTETIAEQPLVRGVADFAARLSGRKSGSGGVMDAIIQTVQDIPASFVPTLLYQIRQATDNTIREQYQDDKMKVTLNKVINKLPFVSQKLEKTYKTLGVAPKDRFHGGSNTLFNVFFNPAFINKYNPDPMVEWILRPYEELGTTEGFPRIVGRELSVTENSLSKAIGKENIEEALKLFGATKKARKFNIKPSAKDLAWIQKEMARRTEEKFKVLMEKERTPEKQVSAMVGKLNWVSENVRKDYLKRKFEELKRGKGIKGEI